MADVGDRGQIILVIGLVLAVMFVALSLVLNTAIFTENLATRSNDGAADSAIEYHHDAIASTQDAIEYANANDNADYPTLEASVEKSVRDYNNLSSIHNARNGKVTDAVVTSHTRGIQVEQRASSTLTNRTGTASWTLATDAEGVRNFRMNVNPESTSCTQFSDCFYVELEDASGDTWRMNVEEDGSGNVEVAVENATGTYTCSTTSATAWINVTAGTVGGQPCDALQFGQGLSPDYDVRFVNGDQTVGTYELVIGSNSFDSAQYGSTDSEPDYEDAIYATTIDITYKHPDLTYSNTVEVVPEESA
ncbi:hypothetical protein [Haladaptatus sp. DJG-WS-42]|uniref:hypothetical protein n=1 Tax=Haladaptatus sp. DJG-WS-42 TaxID=3120516 RepID=UPI0030CE749B